MRQSFPVLGDVAEKPRRSGGSHCWSSKTDFSRVAQAIEGYMMNVLKQLCISLLVLVGVEALAEQPNILWLTSEDHGPHMGCYGDTVARTPHIDALAQKGMIFTRVWSCVPVCAPARTAIITGMYPSSTGAIHMRSMVPLPANVVLFPQLLRQAGYYCTNNVKEDYNVPKPPGTWDESSNRAHWRNRRAGQPFFSVFNSTRSHESQIRKTPHKLITDPQAVCLPAYHPDLAEVRRDWAQYYDQVSAADADAGLRLKELQEDGLEEDTIVFYFSDHGSGMPRHKRWAGNSGLHVPLVVYFPPKWRHLAPRGYTAGGRSERLINFVDLAPTVLSLAGIRPPDWMQGRAFAGPFSTDGPQYLFGERGRMDECMDLVRSATDGRYVYIRNYYTHISHGQYLPYQLSTPTTRLWRQLFLEGKTNQAQSRFWKVPREPEELYDLEADPDEVNNLANLPSHREILLKFRRLVLEHQAQIRDVGLLPEGEMHARCRDRSPYDVARSGEEIPIGRILETADWASRGDDEHLATLVERLADADGAVRYWAAMGILMRGAAAVSQHREALHRLLEDSSWDVRVAAARALALHDPIASGRQLAQEWLVKWCHGERYGLFTAVAALQAVEALGERGKAWVESIQRLPDEVTGVHPRMAEYFPRMKRNVLQQLGVLPFPWETDR